MNYRRFALALLLSVSAPAFAASAASVVMVQFGSFETQAEAQKRLNDVKAAHGATLGNLTMAVREVKLPPDNLTVYRTQAGPLDTRTAAQSICTKLANTGDECYVVETAVSGSQPSASVAAAAPVAAPAPAAAPAPVAMAAPAPAATMSTGGPALAALNAPAAAPVVVNAPAPSPEMQSALDRAAQNQPVLTAAPLSLTAAKAPAEKPSFWSRLNPFSDSEPTPADAPKSNLKPDFQPAPEVMAVPASPMLTPTTPPEPQLAANAINLAPATAQPYESLPLLPPPPPLTARDEEFLRQNMAAQPEVIAKPIPQAPAAAPAPTAAAVAAPVAVASAPLPPADGSVRVEEAKRVPLTETVQPVSTPPLVTTPPQPPAVSLLPASTLGQKTLWAQIGQFNDPQSALAFWENYRRAHPDFPVVRVRVTSSVAQQRHGNDRVWLRVGPFAREGSIRNLCSSLDLDWDSKLRCGNVTDIGAAGSSSPSEGYLNGSRYKR